ncbi:hypothetical protein KR084_011766 [Drosophila pseudotakahashii]|nr:hypothetical protein KR084_011766 [Drosophila pseudotakahashii]
MFPNNFYKMKNFANPKSMFKSSSSTNDDSSSSLQKVAASSAAVASSQQKPAVAQTQPAKTQEPGKNAPKKAATQTPTPEALKQGKNKNKKGKKNQKTVPLRSPSQVSSKSSNGSHKDSSSLNLKKNQVKDKVVVDEKATKGQGKGKVQEKEKEQEKPKEKGLPEQKKVQDKQKSLPEKKNVQEKEKEKPKEKALPEQKKVQDKQKSLPEKKNVQNKKSVPEKKNNGQEKWTSEQKLLELKIQKKLSEQRMLDRMLEPKIYQNTYPDQKLIEKKIQKKVSEQRILDKMLEPEIYAKAVSQPDPQVIPDVQKVQKDVVEVPLEHIEPPASDASEENDNLLTIEGEENDNQKNEEPDEGPQHPLSNRWTLWYLENDRTKTWEEMLHEVTSFDTVENFWSLVTHIKPPSELKVGSDYCLFKKGIRPMWEDEANCRGGRWVISLSKTTKTDLDNFWMDSMLCLIGEASDNSDELCGVVVNIRGKSNKISVWTADGGKEEAVLEIGRKLREGLHMDSAYSLQYQLHKDTMVKQGSTVKSIYTL